MLALPLLRESARLKGDKAGVRKQRPHATVASPPSVRRPRQRAPPAAAAAAAAYGIHPPEPAQHMRRRHRTCVHRRARAAPVALARAVLRDSTGRPLSTNIVVRVTPQAASRPQSSWGRGRGRRRSAPDSSPSALPWPGSQLLVLSTARRHLDVLNNLCTRKRAARAQSWERARSAPGSSASPCSSPAGTDVAPLRLP